MVQWARNDEGMFGIPQERQFCPMMPKSDAGKYSFPSLIGFIIMDTECQSVEVSNIVL